MNLEQLILPAGSVGGRDPGDPVPGLVPPSFADSKDLILLIPEGMAEDWNQNQDAYGGGVHKIAAAGPLTDGRYYLPGHVVCQSSIGNDGIYEEGFLRFDDSEYQNVEVISKYDLPALLPAPVEE